MMTAWYTIITAMVIIIVPLTDADFLLSNCFEFTSNLPYEQRHLTKLYLYPGRVQLRSVSVNTNYIDFTFLEV